MPYIQIIRRTQEADMEAIYTFFEKHEKALTRTWQIIAVVSSIGWLVTVLAK
jgi:hypothetical protein